MAVDLLAYGVFFYDFRTPSALSGFPSAVECVLHHAGEPISFGSFCSVIAACGTDSLTSPDELVMVGCCVWSEDGVFELVWASITPGMSTNAAARPKSLIVMMPPGITRGISRAYIRPVMPTAKRWSKRVTETSNALDLESGVFSKKSPHDIAVSLKRSAERSARRKADPYRSAMSMLTFYINRAGKNLSATRLETLDRAKVELRKLYHR
jgi:hypothetical protein